MNLSLWMRMRKRIGPSADLPCEGQEDLSKGPIKQFSKGQEKWQGNTQLRPAPRRGEGEERGKGAGGALPPGCEYFHSYAGEDFPFKIITVRQQFSQQHVANFHNSCRFNQSQCMLQHWNTTNHPKRFSGRKIRIIKYVFYRIIACQ